MRIGFLISHPIQYLAPLFRELAKQCDLTVFYAHRQTAEQQARAGFDVAFEWDVDLLSGYHSKFLHNVAHSSASNSNSRKWACRFESWARCSVNPTGSTSLSKSVRAFSFPVPASAG